MSKAQGKLDFSVHHNAILLLKGLFMPKKTFCHHLLPLKLFQTCMNAFLPLNTKEDILKNGRNCRKTSLRQIFPFPQSYQIVFAMAFYRNYSG